MPFGRYRGTPLRDLPDGYLGWLASIALRPRLRAAVEAEIDRRDRGRTWPTVALPKPCPAPETARELIGAGLRALARQHHPDAGGSHEDMVRVTVVADWLRQRVGGAA